MRKRIWDSDEVVSLRASLEWVMDNIGESQGNYWVGLGLDACRVDSVPLGAATIYGSLKVMKVCSLFGVNSEKYNRFVEGYRTR